MKWNGESRQGTCRKLRMQFLFSCSARELERFHRTRMHTSVKKMNRGQRKTTGQTRTGSKAEDGANNLFFFFPSYCSNYCLLIQNQINTKHQHKFY